MRGMVNRQGRYEGGLRIERDGKWRREGDGRIEIGEGRKGRRVPAHQTLHATLHD
jgi:hypothetical protein